LTEYYGAAIASRLMGGVVFQTGGADKRIVKPENF
jgi:hypothetical protein